jgi:maltose alpha-D-glucosyltransferase/alpha-amylase
MLRSFHYAAYGVLTGDVPDSDVRQEDVPFLTPWAELWCHWTSARYLAGYLGAVAVADLLPADPDHLEGLLDLYCVEKALYEIGYELNHRPSWAPIPMRGLLAAVD